jgi:phospholipid transport system substrate-binding protein
LRCWPCNLALAAQEAPDALVRRLSGEVLNDLRADPALKGGNIDNHRARRQKRDAQCELPPHDGRCRGAGWRRATPEQQARLQEGFKTLLIRTYSGALAQVGEQTVVVKPLRAAPEDTDVLVRTEVRGRGDPVSSTTGWRKHPGEGAGWKIYNLNVLGVWLVETYRSQFAQEINARGIDGLIETLEARNKSNAAKG